MPQLTYSSTGELPDSTTFFLCPGPLRSPIEGLSCVQNTRPCTPSTSAGSKVQRDCPISISATNRSILCYIAGVTHSLANQSDQPRSPGGTIWSAGSNQINV